MSFDSNILRLTLLQLGFLDDMVTGEGFKMTTAYFRYGSLLIKSWGV